MIKTLSHAVLSIVSLRECDGCHAEVESPNYGNACLGCWERTRIFSGNETLCRKCGAFLFGGPAGPTAARCRRCEDHLYDRALAVGVYEHALSFSILRLKRVPYIPARLRPMLSKLGASFQSDEPPVIVPVPLSRRRLRERGFNQAEIIARIIAHSTGFELDSQSLFREKETPVHRAGMDRKARVMTVKSAFGISRPRLIKGRSVILVDDVMTSGATASACAAELKKNGAATVNVVTVARAV